MDRSLSEDLEFFLKNPAPQPPGAASGLSESLGTKYIACQIHGHYASSGVRYLGIREVWTRCPDCEEASTAAARNAEALQLAEQARQRVERQIGESMVPARFIGRTFENFVADTPEKVHALTVAADYATNFKQHAKKGESLVLFGLPGTGKSHLAAGILQAIIPEHQGLYLTCMGMIRMVRNTWRRDSERSESEVLKTLADVDLLVIDEVGVQYGTDGEQTVLFDVLDRRYRDLQPTLLLSNQDVAGLKTFLGDRAMDRLKECARFVPCQWPSYRPQARKAIA